MKHRYTTPKGVHMAKDKREPLRDEWKRRNTEVFTLRLSKTRDKQIIDRLKRNRPYLSYVRNVFEEHMDKNEQIAVALGIAAEYCRREDLMELHHRIMELASQFTDMTGAELERKAHQLLEMERALKVKNNH